MPKQSYALEPGGENRITIAWKGAFAYNDVSVTLDGSPLGSIPDKNALKTGQKFRLPDGLILKVKLVITIYGEELRLLHNGQPLPGSVFDPEAKLKSAVYIVFFIGGASIILGIITLLFDIEYLRADGIGFFTIIYGLAFLLLGALVWRKSSVALILAIVIFSLDFLLSKFLPTAWGYEPGLSGISRMIMLIPMIQGIGAIKTLKAGNDPTALH